MVIWQMQVLLQGKIQFILIFKIVEIPDSNTIYVNDKNKGGLNIYKIKRIISHVNS
jgi:hypothetical protein